QAGSAGQAQRQEEGSQGFQRGSLHGWQSSVGEGELQLPCTGEGRLRSAGRLRDCTLPHRRRGGDTCFQNTEGLSICHCRAVTVGLLDRPGKPEYPEVYWWKTVRM